MIWTMPSLCHALKENRSSSTKILLQGHVLVNPFVDVQLLPSSPRFSEWREITSASASPTARQQQSQGQSLAGFNSLRAGKPTLRAQLAGNFGTRSNSQRGSGGHKRSKEKRGAADSPVTEQLQTQVNTFFDLACL